MRPLVAALPLLLSGPAHAEPPKREEGTVAFRPHGEQKNIPERYRLDAHEFAYELLPRLSLEIAGIDVYDLRFPSPVHSPHHENNTVHAEYYRPHGHGPFPCVIVLDITAGDGQISRLIARHLAQHKVAGLFVQMAYYGPRRPPGSKVRMLSYDLNRTSDAVRQTVLDLRRATAWMESRAELDKTRLGIMGTSLGSFMATLTAEMEPKLGRLAVLLGGGGFVDAYWDHPQAAPYRSAFELLGGTKEQVKKWIAPLDPITHAENLKERRVLIVAAKRDEIVPPRMAEALWSQTGRQRLVWLDAGHISAAVYLLPGLHTIVEHFTKD